MSELMIVALGAGMILPVLLLVYFTLEVPLADAPTHGIRGLARVKARRASSFGPFESLLRLLSTHMSRLPLAKKRKEIDELLVGAGECNGLTPDEFLVVGALSGVAGAFMGSYLFYSGNHLFALIVTGLGPMLPNMHLRSLTKARRKSIDRALPASIDLASLCMSAGLDFPGAIAHVVENMPDKTAPMRQELERILQELGLGRTRKQALQSFAGRVNTVGVKEFVAAVVQSEEKGNPVSEVLAIQATALRGRRSVLAEEAAARAGVLLMLPMMMMVVSIMLILMGPLVIEMIEGTTN